MRAEPQLSIVGTPERLGLRTDEEGLEDLPANGGARRSYEFDGPSLPAWAAAAQSTIIVAAPAVPKPLDIPTEAAPLGAPHKPRRSIHLSTPWV